MSNYEAIKYNFDGSNLSGVGGLSTGTIVEWSASSLPTGFLECNGQTVSRSTYSALFSIVGTTYGAGDGSSTFALPNLSDNVPVGKSNNKALASTGGANTVQTTGNVGGSTANATLSTSQLASHSHDSVLTNAGGDGDPDGGHIGTSSTGATGSGSGHSHNMSATFTGDSTSVIQPYIALIYIIKT